MKKAVFFLLLVFPFVGKTQGLYFPPSTGTTWDTISPSSLGWCANYIDTLNDYLQQEDSRAFILLKDGKIVHEQYFNGYHIDSAHAWNSAGKTMTAFLVGIAQQENDLNINDKTSDYLGTAWTSAPLAKENLITIKEQLRMTSCLDDGVANIFCTDDTCLQYLSDAGTRWAYHNGPYTLLQDVLQSATGTHPTIYVSQKLNGTTGITGAFIKIGYNKIFFSKARSMARFGLLMLNRGNWNSSQVMTDTSFFNELITPSQSLNNAYGYLWWLNGQSNFMLPGSQTIFPGKLYPNTPDDAYAALGKDNQLLVVVPSRDIVFIRMGKSGSSNLVGPQMVDEIWQILDKLMCTPNAIGETKKDSKFYVYPNPTNGPLYINNRKELVSIQLFNILGEAIKNFKMADDLSLEGYPSGIYFLKLYTTSGSWTLRIVKE